MALPVILPILAKLAPSVLRGLGPGLGGKRRRRRPFLTERDKADLLWVKTVIGKTAAAEAVVTMRGRR
jgi:hypothetical protein